MAKKAEKLSKEYLENKIKGLLEQQEKIENIIDQYTELWQKLAGAIEVTQSMLNDLTQESDVAKDTKVDVDATDK